MQHVGKAVRRILRRFRSVTFRSVTFPSLLLQNNGVSPRKVKSIFGQELIIHFFFIQNLSVRDKGRPSFADLKNVWFKDAALFI